MGILTDDEKLLERLDNIREESLRFGNRIANAMDRIKDRDKNQEEYEIIIERLNKRVEELTNICHSYKTALISISARSDSQKLARHALSRHNFV